MEFGFNFARPHSEPPAVTLMRDRFRLTPTQARVAILLAERLTNKEIADELAITPGTARRHTEAVLFRLNVKSRFKVAACLAEYVDSYQGLDAAD